MKKPNKPTSRKEVRKQARQQKKDRKRENFTRHQRPLGQNGSSSSKSQGQDKSIQKRMKLANSFLDHPKQPNANIRRRSQSEDDDENDEEDWSSDSENIPKGRKGKGGDRDVYSDEEIDSDEAEVGGEPHAEGDFSDDEMRIELSADEAEIPLSKAKTSSKKEKSGGKSNMLNEDELELARLEKKLGLNKKDQESWKRMEKGLLDDGFDPELIEFLRSGEELLAKEAKSARRISKASASNDVEIDDDDQDEDGGILSNSNLGEEEDFEGSEESDEEESVNEEDDDIEEEIDPLANAPTTYISSKNIYGDQSSSTSDLGIDKASGQPVDRAVEMKVRSLLNRSSQENATHTLKEINALFESHPTRMVLDSVCRNMLQGASQATGLLFAALTMAIDTRQHKFVSQVIETVVRQIEEDEVDPAKIRILGGLCAISACVPSLLYEALDAIAAKNSLDNKVIEEASVSIVETCGWKLRAADPGRFRQLLLAMASQTGSQRLESHGKSKISYTDEEERAKKWRKWLQRECEEGTSIPPPLAVPFNDFVNAETNGRWWILGASWSARDANGASFTEPAVRAVEKSTTPISLALRNASPQMLRAAESQGFRTQLQQALFCTIMSVEDAIEAFDEITKLRLNDNGERECVRVIMHCCIHSKRYNAFFGLLGARLCSLQSRYKFSFQLAIWDQIKLLDTKALTQSQVFNFAKFVAELISQFSLSLSVLKVVNFAKISSKEKLWFIRECLLALLIFPGENQQGKSTREGDLLAAKLFSRLRSSREGTNVRDGILVFWARTEPFLNASKAKDPLLYRRLNIARRIMEHYVKSEDELREDGDTVDYM